MLLTACVMQTDVDYLDLKGGPISVSTFYGIPKLATKYSRKWQATAVTFIFCMGMALVEMVYLSVKAKTDWLPCWFLVAVQVCPNLRIQGSCAGRTV